MYHVSTRFLYGSEGVDQNPDNVPPHYLRKQLLELRVDRRLTSADHQHIINLAIFARNALIDVSKHCLDRHNSLVMR